MSDVKLKHLKTNDKRPVNGSICKKISQEIDNMTLDSHPRLESMKN